MSDGNLFGAQVNPSVSRWVTVAPNAKLIGQQLKQASTERLLAQAASLVPDYQKLRDYIKERKYSPGDTQFYLNQLNQLTDSFDNSYNQNPFWAFTRESKENIRNMQRLVNDPEGAALQNLYEMSQKEKERLKDNMSYLNYDSGGISVVDKETRRLQKIDIDDYFQNQTRYTPLTLGNEFDYRVNVQGFRQDKTPFEANLSKYEDVIKRIDDFLSKTGSTEWEEAKGFRDDDERTWLAQEGRSNAQQLENKVALIKNGAALSQADYNTIMSNFYQSKIQAGEKPTRKDAQLYFVDLVDSIKKGQLSTKSGWKVNVGLEASQKAAAYKKDSRAESIAQPVSAAQYGQSTVGVTLNDGTRSAAINYNMFPGFVLNQSRGVSKTKDVYGNEMEIRKSNVADLTVLDGTIKTKPLIFDLKSNSPTKGTLIEDKTLSDVSSRVRVKELGLVSLPYTKTENGVKVYSSPMSPQEALDKQTSEAKQGREFEYDNMVLVKGELGALNKKGVWDWAVGNQQQIDNKIINFASQYGLQSTDYSANEQSVTEYLNNTTRTEDYDFEQGINLGVDDEFKIYNVEYLLPLQGRTQVEQIQNIDASLQFGGARGVDSPTIPGVYMRRELGNQPTNLPKNRYPGIEALQQ